MGWDDFYLKMMRELDEQAALAAEEARSRPMTKLSAEDHVLKAEKLLLEAPDYPGHNPDTCHARAALAHAHIDLAKTIKEMGM